MITLFAVVVRLTIILVLFNLRSIIRWKKMINDWIQQCLLKDNQNGRITQPCDTAAAVDTPFFRYYVGPVLHCTQPLPPPASVIIAANFAYPPPPLPEYYIGPAVFDVMGLPPLACCVAESGFAYPPPPPRCPEIRWSGIVPVSNSPKIQRISGQRGGSCSGI